MNSAKYVIVNQYYFFLKVIQYILEDGLPPSHEILPFVLHEPCLL